MLTPSSRVRARPDLLATAIGRELVIMDLGSEHYVDLDPIAARVWMGLREPVALGALCGTLAAEYEAPPGVIERDVLALVAELVDLKLVTVEP